MQDSKSTVESDVMTPDSEFESAADDFNDVEDEIFDSVSLIEEPNEEHLNGIIQRRDSNVSSNSLTLQENLYSTISVESLDLDVPTSYKVETVDFPSSPEALKRVSGESMPVEHTRDRGVGTGGGGGSDDDQDISVYQAQLLSNGQHVRLVKSVKKESSPGGRKVISLACDDFDDLSKTEVDENEKLDCIADSPDEIEDSILSRLEGFEVEPIPELTAVEEAEESRAWRTFNFAEIDRKIDLRVLEPYKRVVSHGGYLSSGSRNAIIVFSACYLPDRTRRDYDYVMNNLFMYVISTLDQLVTDDYVIVYLHGATQRSAMPKFNWIKQCYQMIDRRLRKNLKGLYLVHPTFWLKTLAIMTKPFISSKFSKKLFFVASLSELLRKVPLERASIPDRVIKYDYDLYEEKSILDF